MKPEDIIRIKDLLPTSLGSEEIREKIAGDILRRSVFSARMTSVPYLAKIREVCESVVSGEINQAEATARLLLCLKSLGYDTEGGSQADLANPASERRLNLIVDTQRQMAASVSRLMSETEGTIDMFPGFELCRAGSRAMPRQDWLARWNAAGESVGWQGAHQRPIYGDVNAYGFLALKNSPIWAALGSGAGSFRDTLGNPYPPFAHGSGMAWLDADRETCERFGLLRPGEDAGSPSSPTLSPAEQDILDACDDLGFDLSEGLL